MNVEVCNAYKTNLKRNVVKVGFETFIVEKTEH